MNKKPIKYVLDTSAILSGKPINLNDAEIVTTTGVLKELNPGGRDYQIFQYLKEKGLAILTPNKNAIDEIKKISIKTGDINRLSKIDIEILALVFDLSKDDKFEIILLTDDYSIQNVANSLNLKFETINQTGITKRFKWDYRCRGCGKIFKDSIKICPICGTETKSVVSNKKAINNRSDNK